MINNYEAIPFLEGFFKMGNVHEEYINNDISFSVDSDKKDDDTIIITIKRSTDKQNFEKFVNELDDEIFEKVWESLSNKFGLKELNSMYEGADYKNVISSFKEEAKEITQNKINELQSLLKSLN